ncbi:radical SAM protein [Treponema sp. TIM-1]|uniref:radical SAM protein n=1 Tax=Treponema sp. TIM-1 TaxID=2898417 RepID=UPI0039813868
MTAFNDIDARELSLSEVMRKYPDVSPFVIIKADVQRRGVRFSEAALAHVDLAVHQVEYRGFSRETSGAIPVSLMMRDGTSILTGFTLENSGRPPYLVDVVEDRIVLTDQGTVVEEVDYWEKPDYYSKETSNHIPMWQIALARPQRIDLYPFQYCEFWNTPGHGCKYCSVAATYKKTGKPKYVDLTDIAETLAEALKQPGRYMSLFLTGGSILSGKELLDDEVDLYIKVLREAGKNFKSAKFPSQLIGTAYTKEQLLRLYENTGLSSYTADIEVLNKEKFDWICPGKAAKIGYEEWKDRLYQAVDIFGFGNVNTGIVGGVEMARPKGFTSEDEALDMTLTEAEELAKHGVFTVQCVWTVAEGSVFFNQKTPSLEYYVRLSCGLDRLCRKYHINTDMDNYRRCGNHPDTDLSRI